MNKSELIDVISDSSGLTKADATRSLNACLDAITATLKQGDQITLPGFGTFSVSHRAERTGFNPRTREQIMIPAARVPKFKAGKALKDEIKG